MSSSETDDLIKGWFLVKHPKRLKSSQYNLRHICLTRAGTFMSGKVEDNLNFEMIVSPATKFVVKENRKSAMHGNKNLGLHRHTRLELHNTQKSKRVIWYVQCQKALDLWKSAIEKCISEKNAKVDDASTRSMSSTSVIYLNDISPIPQNDKRPQSVQQAPPSVPDEQKQYSTTDDAMKDLAIDSVTQLQKQDEAQTLTVAVTGSSLEVDHAGGPFIVFWMDVKYSTSRWYVKRRYAEFRTLRSQLSSDINIKSWCKSTGNSLPKLPPKQFFVAHSTSDNVAKQRCKDLHDFITQLLELSIFKESPHFRIMAFLGLLSTFRNDISHVDGSTPRTATAKRNVIHTNKLVQNVNVGDVILFRCTHVGAAMQRTVTQSEWDHVAIVVDDGFMFEAARDGCMQFPILPRVKSYLETGFAFSVGIRKLKKPLSLAQRCIVTEFLRVTHGKPYSLTIKKLVFTKQRARDCDASQTEVTDEGYFCSELVADIYRAIGLIGKVGYDSNYYWPKSFAEGNQIDQEVTSMHLNELGECSQSLGQTILIDPGIAEIADASCIQDTTEAK